MHIFCPDGTRLAATLLRPTSESAAAPLIVINSATAIRRTFYIALATHLTTRGYQVLTWDPRGMGESAIGPARASTARMRDWGALDLEAVLQFAGKHMGGDWQKITVLGHSSGGNLAGLAPSIANVQRLALVASGTCDWRLYPKSQWPRLFAAWHVLGPLALRALGYMPGQLGVGQDLPPGVAWDWRNWSLVKGYLFADESLDLRGYQAFQGELLALNFTDDLGFAPPKTVTDLMRHFSNANATQVTFDPRAMRHRAVGHFGFFNEKNKVLWPLLLDWLDRTHPA
jgi:predicted alpha/beta hydrolase